MTRILIKAAILDMDGVLTKTASLHARAWKALFDAFHDHWKKETGEQFEPFSIQEDYPRYVDGIPRYDGVKNVLESRKVELPYGSEDDPPGWDSICALGNRKNEFFRELLEKEGVEIFDENIAAIRSWKKQGIALGVISSSKNCREVLQRANLLEDFDVRVDGVVSQEKKLKGKPEPDIFLEAARQLGVDKKQALVVEDAPLGVEAARKGDFGRVVGFAEDHDQPNLLRAGADEIVSSLKELPVAYPGKKAAELPSALDHFDDIRQRLIGKNLVLFLDYDGTLTPIVEHHTQAFLSEAMQQKLKVLSQHCRVSVVSGRGLEDVQQRVGIDHLYYAGSHGFEIAGPDGFYDQHEAAAQNLPTIAKAEKQLKDRFADQEGVVVERKKFAIAVHYRNAPEDSIPAIEKKVNDVIKLHPALKKGTGKKILELKPQVDWDKGRAIQYLLQELELNGSHNIPLYIGDDITDEDAFAALRSDGIGILVGDHSQPSQAMFHLHDTEEVGVFLDRLINLLTN